jgi:hypothetical protein
MEADHWGAAPALNANQAELPAFGRTENNRRDLPDADG